jgi:serine O-acetyltransferase
MRLCQGAAQSGGIWLIALPIFRTIHGIATQLAGVDFPWRTDVGAGLVVAHGWGLVVNSGARIGCNVTLFHGVTIGRRDRIDVHGGRVSQLPVIEDDVWIGPHAIVVGGVTIGRGSRIAGGAFVSENVPPFSIVVGNPATVVKEGCVPDVLNAVPL